MEVASPLAFAPTPAGTKRSLTCSPQLLDGNHHASLSEMEIADDTIQPSYKRRRFHAESTAVDSMVERFQSPFFASLPNKNFLTSSSSSHGFAFMKRQRPEMASPPQKDLSRIVEEQASQIAEQASQMDSLKKDKSQLESSLNSLKSDHERVVKENQILRKAVTIQQERQNQAEHELKAAHQYRADAEDKMKKLEQVILSLRYHLQAQQYANHHNGNDFMHNLPPDVY